MTWMLTINAREHELTPGAWGFNTPAIDEIAHSLALINRFTGHTTRPYSVAEHSLLVADLAAADGASAIVQLAALMHDAHEAFAGDVASPVKWVVGEAWSAFEHSQATALHHRFGLRTAMHAHRAAIRRWDLIALATERRDLTAWDAAKHRPWMILDNPAAPVLPASTYLMTPWHTHGMQWTDWRDEFLKRFDMLTGDTYITTHGPGAELADHATDWSAA